MESIDGTFPYVQSFSSELFATQPRQGLKGIQLFSQNSEYRAGWLYIYRLVGPVFVVPRWAKLLIVVPRWAKLLMTYFVWALGPLLPRPRKSEKEKLAGFQNVDL